LAVLAIVSTSCTEDLDVDFEGKSSNRLVVDGRITSDTMNQKIILSRTIDAGSKDVVYETGAEVTLWDSTNLFVLNETEPGVYSTDDDFHGIPGKTYTLNITAKDGEEYEAISRMSPISAIDSIKIKKEYFGFADMDFYKVLFYGQESPEPGQYYMWNIYVNDSLANDTINETMFEEDSYVNGEYMDGIEIYWMTEEEVRDDTVKFELEMLSIPEEYYNYLVEVMMETTWRGSPWDPTPANVSSNISNGAVGFFVAMATTRQSIVYYKTDE